MKLVAVRGRPSVPTTRKSNAQTGNGFSLEFRGLESTHLTDLTAIFLVKQGKIHCRLVADPTKHRRYSVFFPTDSNVRNIAPSIVPL